MLEAIHAFALDEQQPLVVVLTGAGMSAESGIPTFRDANGLWEGHRVEDVASPEGWVRHPERVLEFYNLRRKAAWEAQPNAGHLALAQLEQHGQVVVITQNVDDLHERAGSTRVLHLHGELRKVRSTAHPELVYDRQGNPVYLGDLCERGSQLRPHIVWFGEEVPHITAAAALCTQADFFVIIGTSLAVYPAAGLIDYVPDKTPKYIIDRKIPAMGAYPITRYELPASEGVPLVTAQILQHLKTRGR
ncbi:MAG: NAD-dependent deacylase [Bacteroidetes bacterium]|nr:NAD-dependent deacylase [Bacteroidota bacterium]